MKAQPFDNTPAERARLVKKLAQFPDLVVCLEATGVYSLDLAVALHDAGIRLVVLNPKAALGRVSAGAALPFILYRLAPVTAIGKNDRPERGIATGRNGSMWGGRMTIPKNSGRSGALFAMV